MKTNGYFHRVFDATRSIAFQNLVVPTFQTNASNTNKYDGSRGSRHLKHLTKIVCGVGNAHVLENRHTADTTIACRFVIKRYCQSMRKICNYFIVLKTPCKSKIICKPPSTCVSNLDLLSVQCVSPECNARIALTNLCIARTCQQF